MNAKFRIMLSNVWYGVIEKIFWIFPINEKKICISSYFGKGYGDNPKYIVEELHGRTNAYKIIWIVKNMNDTNFPEWIIPVKRHSLAALYHIATAGIWIDNCRKHRALKRRKKQKYIQTWHGSVALKKVENDAKEKLDILYIKDAVQDSKNATLFISNGNWCTNWFRNSYWYDGKIIESGTPKIDILINAKTEEMNKFRKKAGVKSGYKIAIYAPTFRVNNNTDCYCIDYERLIKSLEKRFGGEWVVLLRLHPNLAGSHISTKTNNTVEVTDYPDMYELLAISDVLITDYSSTMFEMSYTKKPVFLFATDINDYMNDRGTYFTFDELPFPLAENNDELEKNILNFDSKNYIEKSEAFLKRLGAVEDGHASERVVDAIINNEC